ncbi:MAG: Trk system potassium transporter TrkA [Alphaproteobacteria bacterium]|nr:Trk system potassium transporter TrkA [Alphaproteobacteria bacterium]
MKVIICGAGQVGSGIAERLAAEGNDISIIDANVQLVERANDVLEVRALRGNGAHPDVLERAGAREADMLIAVTLHDEVNMVACQVAHTLFDIPTKIARVRSQTYLSDPWSKLFSRDSMAIDFIISPEIEVGNMVMRRLETPGAFETASFGDGHITLLGISCDAECPLIDTPLEQLSELFPDLPAVAVAIVRDDRLIVPHSSDQIHEGDGVYVITPSDQTARVLQVFGHEETQARRIVIAGGGNIGFYIAKAFEAADPNLRLKIVEADHNRAMAIAEQLQSSVVLNGSALNEDLLREADISAADTLVAVTNDDQVNLLTSALAKQLGCGSSFCLINSPNYMSMVRSLNIDAFINPRATTVSRVLQHVRRGRIRGVHSVLDGAGEVIEAEVLETAPIVGKPIKEIDVGDGVRLGCILRDGTTIIPKGATELLVKDRVVLFSRADRVRDVEHLFRVSPDYF